MKKEFKLYNIILPIWLLYYFPVTWIVVLPANFLIDFLVTYLSLKHLKVNDVIPIIKKTIFKTWIFGFLADFIGGVLMFLTNFVEGSGGIYDWWYKNIISGIMMNPFTSIYSFIYVLFCIAVSSYFIYIFNMKFVFNNIEIEDDKKDKLSLYLAIFTAPIFFLIPSGLFMY
ncbi:MAG: hypothetical protein WBH68_06315 [Erysipelotrichaceae bacterium]|jgi:hypothetical protein|nr:hypothetical protein [Bacillota bacterium]